VYKYLYVKNILTLNIMSVDTLDDDIDKIINDVNVEQLGASLTAKCEAVPALDPQREKLICVVAGGNSKKYLGKIFSTTEIEDLDDKEILKLYARYEAHLGGLITRTLNKQMISAYTKGVQAACPSAKLKLDDIDKLNKNLSESPFINLALTSLTCMLYHQYGNLLAPVEAALITSNHLSPIAESKSETS
jgi:hypothetical protein